MPEKSKTKQEPNPSAWVSLQLLKLHAYDAALSVRASQLCKYS